MLPPGSQTQILSQTTYKILYVLYFNMHLCIAYYDTMHALPRTFAQLKCFANISALFYNTWG